MNNNGDFKLRYKLQFQNYSKLLSVKKLKGMLLRNIENFLKKGIYEKLGISEMKKLIFFFLFPNACIIFSKNTTSKVQNYQNKTVEKSPYSVNTCLLHISTNFKDIFKFLCFTLCL